MHICPLVSFSSQLLPQESEVPGELSFYQQCHTINPPKHSILHPDVLMEQQGSKDGVTVKEMQVVIKQYQNIASVLREAKSAILLSRPIKNLYLQQSLWVKNAEYFFFSQDDIVHPWDTTRWRTRSRLKNTYINLKKQMPLQLIAFISDFGGEIICYQR